MESNKKAAVMNMDIIVEILSTLLVKDLIRFKSVCKSWLQLISSQEFIQLHLKRSSFRDLLQGLYFFGSPPHRNCLLCPRPKSEMCMFVGNSCDGLACLVNKRFGIIHIWNPAIRESACFPTKKIRLPTICYWFGIHDDEYKLILGTGPYRLYDVDEDDLDSDDDDDDDYDGEYEMHLINPYVDSHSYKSTRQGFRKEEDQEFEDKLGTFFSGNVHWVVSSWHEEEDEEWGVMRSRKYSTILCYNLREEKVGRIAVPTQVDSYILGEMDGYFSALLFPDDYRGYEVWVMKEYGVNESWTKLMFIEAELGRTLTYRSPLVSKEGCVESLVNPKTRH